MTLESFHALPEKEAVAHLRACCESARWARAVAAERPYASREALLIRARELWRAAGEAELLVAFAAHPRIGDVEHLRARFAGTASDPAKREQGQVLAAEEAVLQRLKTLNDAYLDRFGFIFIVCATGKSAAEMLALLEARIDNEREAELAIAAREQEAIMELRLARMLEEGAGS